MNRGATFEPQSTKIAHADSIENDILLVLPVPVRLINGTLHIESQAANGLDRWADNFNQVVAACPLLPEHEVGRRSSWSWSACAEIANADRVRMVPLPWAYSPTDFLKSLGSVRAQLRHEIAGCRFLQFAVGGLFGDWASVAALEASHMNRPFSVWTDRVESDVVRISAEEKAGLKKPLTLLYADLMRRYERYVIKHAHVGLFHGAETFHAYNQLTQQAFTTHDVHTKKADLISSSELDEKLASVHNTSKQLKIGYAGRATSMKAPLDWLGVLARLVEKGVPFEAAWLGDGELIERMKQFVDEHGLKKHVVLKGFVSNRAEVLAFLRSCDLLLFTHITPESPRIILEAMISGTPVVGYTSSYVEEIIPPSDHDLLCKIGDVKQLAETAASLAVDRTKLVAAMRRAREVGMSINDDAVFKHRSDLIKQYLA